MWVNECASTVNLLIVMIKVPFRMLIWIYRHLRLSEIAERSEVCPRCTMEKRQCLCMNDSGVLGGLYGRLCADVLARCN